MVIFYGTKLAGKIDEMEDGSFVATRFVHVMFVPLIPFATYWVLSQEGSSFTGHKLPFSFKSVLVAYFRMFLLALGLGSVGAFAIGIIALIQGSGQAISNTLDVDSANPIYWSIGSIAAGLLVAGACVLTYRWMYSWLKITPSRYEEIVEYVNNNHEQSST